MIAAAWSCAPESPIEPAPEWWWDCRCGGRSLRATARTLTSSPVATRSPLWGGRRRSTTVWWRSKRYEGAHGGGGDVTLVNGPDAVVLTYRDMRRVKHGTPRQHILDVR